MKQDTLYLFTHYFPFGNKEPFIEKEIPVLAKRFKKVIIFPLIRESGVRPLPQNVEVEFLFEGYRQNVLRTIASAPVQFLRTYIPEVYRKVSQNELRKYFLISQADKMQRAVILDKHLSGKSPSIFYIYWFADWVEILANSSFKPRVPIISRAHGYDVFGERNRLGFIPFRRLHFQTVAQVYSVSEHGADYLKSKYPEFAEKIKVSRLGVQEEGDNPFKKESVFNIVTCSNLSPVKRLHLMPEILSFMKIPVRWTHLGGGEGLENLKKACSNLPGNVHCIFKGEMKNSEILEYYRNEPVHLFLNVSESEGIPVSIMEAISFGIPVLATDVGGNSEIITPETGVLIDKEFDTEEVASGITTFLSGPLNSPEYRYKVKQFWLGNFNAEKAFNEFSDILIKRSERN